MLIVKIRCKLSEIRGTENLFIDVFDHDMEQRRNNVTTIEYYVDKSLRLFICDVARQGTLRGKTSLSANKNNCSIKAR